MPAKRLRSRILHVESLETRCVLSFIFPVDADQHGDGDVPGEIAGDELHSANGGGPVGQPIRLDLVALHEFGHSLGLDHTSDTSSIMYAYYNPNYNLGNFANDSAVATLRTLYANVSTSPWKDSLDPSPGNGKVDVTYSFMPDGARMDKGTSTTYATFDRIFGVNGWQSTFAAALGRWATASNGHLAFAEHSDAGSGFNYSGASQNDGASGDIRIGAHRFDGAGKVLAHTYFPPPNGVTAAGDAHFDQAENWILTASASGTSTQGGSGGSRGNLMLGSMAGDFSPAVLLVTMEAGEVGSESIATPFGAETLSDSESQSGNAQFVGISSETTVTNLAENPRVIHEDGPVDTSSDTDRDRDEGMFATDDVHDPEWLDALAWQRLEFGQV